MAKNVLNSINFGKLHKVKQTNSTEQLFKFFFINLYYEKETSFDWSQFIQKLKKKQFQIDFQKRLALLDIFKMERSQRDRIHVLKNMNFEENRKNEDLLKLLEWLEYSETVYIELRNKDELLNKNSDYLDKENKYSFQKEVY